VYFCSIKKGIRNAKPIFLTGKAIEVDVGFQKTTRESRMKRIEEKPARRSS
jgi:hypothetical protein